MTQYIEQETVVNWNEEEDVVSIYTASPVVYRKCLKMGFKLTKTDRYVKTGEETGWWFEVGKGCVSFRKPSKQRILTAERREAMRTNLNTVRKNRSKGIYKKMPELKLGEALPAQ